MCYSKWCTCELSITLQNLSIGFQHSIYPLSVHEDVLCKFTPQRIVLSFVLVNLYLLSCVLILKVHAYERMNRIYNYNYDPCAPVYITVGDGGNHENLAIPHADEPGHCPQPSATVDSTFLHLSSYCGFNFTSGPASGQFCWDRQPDWSAFRDSSFGHGIIEVTALHIQLLFQLFVNCCVLCIV